MDSQPNPEPDLTEITTQVVGLLKPLGEDARRRVLGAASLLLGTAAAMPVPKGTEIDTRPPQAEASGPKAQAWIKQNGLTTEQVEQVFHIAADGVSVIAASLPGKDMKEQSHNAYVLLGVGRLLATGDTAFDDKEGRALCEQLGCLNKPNHATYMAEIGNLLVGSKQSGWRLTAPGLKHGAALVKQLASGE